MNAKNENLNKIMETVESESAQTSKSVKYGTIFFCITTLIQLMTSVVYMYNSDKDRKEQAYQYQMNRGEQAKQYKLNREFEILKMKYASQDGKYKEVQYSMINVRDDLLNIYNICNNNSLNNSQIKKLKTTMDKLRRDRVALIQDSGTVRIMFTAKIDELFRGFTLNVEKVIESVKEETCPTYLPDAYFWRKIYWDINSNMLKEAYQTEIAINENLYKPKN